MARGNDQDLSFTVQLPTPMPVGTHIVVTGTPKDNEWIMLNLRKGEDIVVHFNVRFDDSSVVLNTRELGEWGTEQIPAPRPFPFEVGRQFKIEIAMHENETSWSVDGEHYCTYQHRKPSPLLANVVQIAGVKIAELSFSHQ